MASNRPKQKQIIRSFEELDFAISQTQCDGQACAPGKPQPSSSTKEQINNSKQDRLAQTLASRAPIKKNVFHSSNGLKNIEIQESEDNNNNESTHDAIRIAPCREIKQRFNLEQGHSYKSITLNYSSGQDVFHSFDEIDCISENNSRNTAPAAENETERLSSNHATKEQFDSDESRANQKHCPSINIRDNGRTIVFGCQNIEEIATDDSPSFMTDVRSRRIITQKSPISLDVDRIDSLLDTEGDAILGRELINYLKGYSIAIGRIKQLIKMGSSINSQDQSGKSPIMVAVYNEYVPVDILEYLLNLDANLELEDCNGDTALFYAIRQPFINKIRAIIAHGANIRHRNRRGESFYFKSYMTNFKNKQAVLDYLKPFNEILCGKRKDNPRILAKLPPDDARKQRETVSYHYFNSKDTTISSNNITSICHDALAQCHQYPEYLEQFDNGWILAFVAHKNNTDYFSNGKGMLVFSALPVIPFGGITRFCFLTTSSANDPLKIIFSSGSETHQLVLKDGTKTRRISARFQLPWFSNNTSLTLCFPLKDKEWFLCYAYK